MARSDTGARGRTPGRDRPWDVARQTTVVVSAVVGIVGAFLGSGAAVGTPIAEAAGGALAADATLVAPGGPAFGIWSVIYTGLAAYAVWQALPARRADVRQRRVGWLVAASLLLNAAWILTVQAGSVPASVAVIAGLLAVLVAAFLALVRSRPSSLLERVLLDGTVGLYLGWVTIATVANVAAALAAGGYDPGAAVATAWAVAVLLVAAALGLLLAVAGGGRVAPAGALAWGLVWISVARSTGEPESAPVAAAAATAAAVVVIGTAAVRLRRRRPLAAST